MFGKSGENPARTRHCKPDEATEPLERTGAALRTKGSGKGWGRMKASQETGLSKLREDSRGIEAAEVFPTHSPETRRGAALEEDHWEGPFPVWNGPLYYPRQLHGGVRSFPPGAHGVRGAFSRLSLHGRGKG